MLSFIKSCTGSVSVEEKETIQTLWSGYGSIIRYALTGGPIPSVIIKQIALSTTENHPRGWNSTISHDRKLKSYEIETHWYENFNSKCDSACRTPKCYGVMHHEGNVIIVLEDLDASGFPVRKTDVNLNEIKACLQWLANFHANFMEVKPKGLWPIGTYWHLATRPEELKVLDDVQLKTAAPIIDKTLNECTFQTLVHGDAKLANFCFSEGAVNGNSNDTSTVSAVDFQYVGGGCGMKDVAYFLGSCLNDQDCETHETDLLDYYFKELKTALHQKKPNINFHALEQEWRQLFPVAWTDFHRFLKGWSPGHWKLTSYSERMAQKVMSQLTSQSEAIIVTNKKGKLYHIHLQELKEIAAVAAKKAGNFISLQRSVHHNRIIKKGGNTEASQIVTTIDYKSQEMILSHLLPTCKPYNLGLLTEEAPDDSSRLVKDYFWCVDPLDGTLPFVEGATGYAVSIALVSKEGESVLGIVYDPEKDVLYEAIKGLGCWRNGKKWKLKKPTAKSQVLFNSNRSFQKLPTYPLMKKSIENISDSLGYGQVVEQQKGGSVMNAIWTLENTPGCYVALPKKQDGGGSIWDFAATACIFTELGIPPTDCNGNPLKLNEKNTTFMNKQGIVFASSNQLKNSLLLEITT